MTDRIIRGLKRRHHELISVRTVTNRRWDSAQVKQRDLSPRVRFGAPGFEPTGGARDCLIGSSADEAKASVRLAMIKLNVLPPQRQQRSRHRIEWQSPYASVSGGNRCDLKGRCEQGLGFEPARRNTTHRRGTYGSGKRNEIAVPRLRIGIADVEDLPRNARFAKRGDHRVCDVINICQVAQPIPRCTQISNPEAPQQASDKYCPLFALGPMDAAGPKNDAVTPGIDLFASASRTPLLHWHTSPRWNRASVSRRSSLSQVRRPTCC